MESRATSLGRIKLPTAPIRWVAYGGIIGVVSGGVAVLFFVGLEAATHWCFSTLAREPLSSPPGDALLGFGHAPPGAPRPWVFFLLPIVGGLLSGLTTWWLAPEAEGHGTDAVLHAFHRDQGRIRARVPLVKGVATVFTLAGGGSAGKEGPIAQIGAGIGSLLAKKLGLSTRDRRILLLAGMAGGLGAIFRAPLGSALTAIEVLYHDDFESDALIPCVVSSVAAYVTFVLALGSSRIFDVPVVPLLGPLELLGFVLLALVGVPIGRAYIWLFYAVRDAFRRLPGPRPLRPALGGLGVALIGLAFPQAYGAGWGQIQSALDGEIVVATLGWIVVAKIAATCLTIPSGGSGGVFGPTLFIGGMLGGLIGYGGNALVPALFPHPAAYVLVGMASFFAGVASAPIGAMLMVAEMTGGYTLLPALMLVSVIAILLMPGRTIYENQVRDRFRSPAHQGDLTLNVLEEMKVADVFLPRSIVDTVRPEATFQSVRAQVMSNEDATVPVVDEDGTLVGLLTAEQIRAVIDETELDRFVVARDICAPPVFVEPDDNLFRAHEYFRASGCPQIPVIDEAAGKIVGIIDYRDMMRAYEAELSRRRTA